MGSFLATTPLTAIIFAAVWQFAALFFPVSQSYSEVLAAFKMPLPGYLFMIAVGLWLSIISALVAGSSKDKGMKTVMLTLLALLLTQMLAPMLKDIQFGETSGIMTRADSLFKLASGSVAILILMILTLLLFKRPPNPVPSVGAHPKTPDKYKVKKLDLAIKLIVLPIIYCVVYFLVWYFVLWRSEAVRVYYSGSAEHDSFIQTIINMLLTDSKQVPMSLIKGLLFSLGLLPLLFQLPGKRAMFIISSVMLLIGPALQMLIPSPVMPDAVRIAHLIEIAVGAVVFGALGSLMLHFSIYKVAVAHPPAVHANTAAVKHAAAPSTEKA